MEVQISGCVFSSLFLELGNSQGDIEGFLLGEISHRSTTTVSDSQDISVKHQLIFAVHEIAVCQGLFSFYDGVGQIHVEKLTQILGKKKQLVLGWFKSRRNSRLDVSMRERAIHKNLLEQLRIKESENFIFTVFTSQHTKSVATHAFYYSAFYYPNHSRVFNVIPMGIINLGDTAQTEYKHDIAATRSTSKQYQNVIGSFRDEFLDNVGQLQQVEHAHSMYKSMLGKLKALKESVHSSESQLRSLSDNVDDLKWQLEKAALAKRLKPDNTRSRDIKQEPDLIILDDESEDSEKDLMLFDDSESMQGPIKHVIVAKHINTNHVNETNCTETSKNHNTGRSALQQTNAEDDHNRSYQSQNLSPEY